MTRRCSVTGKTVRVGCHVSHSHIRTNRKLLPNLHHLMLQSDILNRKVSLRISAHGLRTIEHNHGLDNYLLTTSSSRLTIECLRLKRLLKKELKNRAS